MPQPNVKPGQVWQDNDKRMLERRVLVERVDPPYAYCKARTGRKVRLLIRRMKPTSTGWSLVCE